MPEFVSSAASELLPSQDRAFNALQPLLLASSLMAIPSDVSRRAIRVTLALRTAEVVREGPGAGALKATAIVTMAALESAYLLLLYPARDEHRQLFLLTTVYVEHTNRSRHEHTE